MDGIPSGLEDLDKTGRRFPEDQVRLSAAIIFE